MYQGEKACDKRKLIIIIIIIIIITVVFFDIMQLCAILPPSNANSDNVVRMDPVLNNALVP
jgi:hypothetical protein